MNTYSYSDIKDFINTLVLDLKDCGYSIYNQDEVETVLYKNINSSNSFYNRITMEKDNNKCTVISSLFFNDEELNTKRFPFYLVDKDEYLNVKNEVDFLYI